VSERPTSLIFDLDGTLSNPAEGIARSINYALLAFGYTPIARDDVSQYIGPPLDQTFRAITGSSSAEHATEFVAKFRERYADVGYAENTLYDGIPDALSALRDRGHVLGLCTSKRVDFADRILRLFGLREHFTFVSGGDVGIHKGEQLRALLHDGAIDTTSVMIGDRAVDVRAAKQNGLRSVGVLWGHGSEAELIAAEADTLLREVRELSRLSVDHARKPFVDR
jgi:phosphoglycolate phosphatase